MRGAAFSLVLLAVLFALADVVWGNGFDGRGLLAVCLSVVALVLWALAPPQRVRVEYVRRIGQRVPTEDDPWL